LLSAKKGVKKSARKGVKKSAKKAAKKGAKKSARKTSSGKRTLISPRGDKRYVRRSKGRFSESDDQGRSLSRDRRKKAKTKSKPGQGDRGDR
jgi:hypothetical protein